MTKPPLLTKNNALFLDFDGTLVDFAPSPDQVITPSHLLPTLNDLRDGLDGAFGLITGRSITSLGRHLPVSDFTVAGEHGGQWRVLGETASSLKPVSFRSELVVAHDRFDGNEGIEIEEKAGGFAVHYRLAPQWERLVKSLMHECVAERPDLQILEGNQLVELRAKGVHKGAAIDRFMNHPTFANRTPVYVGDDTTDEDAFESVNIHGGISVKVGEGATCATYHLQDIDAVYEWLSRSRIALEAS